MALTHRRRGDQATRWDQPTRWDPFEEMDRFAQLVRMLGEGGVPMLPGIDFTPLADVEETDDAYIIELELPAVKKDDIDVEVSDNRVVVTGERKEKERKGILRRRTRTVGRFRYEIELPTAVDGEGVVANLDQGELIIRVPKVSTDAARHITVD